MHSVPMQGGMPMAMPQTMYMSPGQQPMYVQGPAYGMPPGEPILLCPAAYSFAPVPNQSIRPVADAMCLLDTSAQWPPVSYLERQHVCSVILTR